MRGRGTKLSVFVALLLAGVATGCTLNRLSRFVDPAGPESTFQLKKETVRYSSPALRDRMWVGCRIPQVEAWLDRGLRHDSQHGLLEFHLVELGRQEALFDHSRSELFVTYPGREDSDEVQPLDGTKKTGLGRQLGRVGSYSTEMKNLEQLRHFRITRSTMDLPKGSGPQRLVAQFRIYESAAAAAPQTVDFECVFQD